MKYNNKQLTKKDKIDKELERINKEIKKIKIHGGAIAPSTNESIIGNYNYSVDHLLSNKIYLDEPIIIWPKPRDKSIVDFIPENERPIDNNRFCHDKTQIQFEDIIIRDWTEHSHSDSIKFEIPLNIEMTIKINFNNSTSKNYNNINFEFNKVLNKGNNNLIILYNYKPNYIYNMFNIVIKVLFYRNKDTEYNKAKNNLNELNTTIELEKYDKCNLINTTTINLENIFHDDFDDEDFNIRKGSMSAIIPDKVTNIKKYIRYQRNNDIFFAMIIMPQAEGSLDKIINSFNLKDKILLFKYILEELKCLAEYEEPDGTKKSKVYLDIKIDQLLYFKCSYGLKIILGDMGGIYNANETLNNTRSIWTLS